MRVLDIDMDFFQSDIHFWGDDSSLHLIDDSFSVWEEERFIDFIENRCGLSLDKPLRGRIFNSHVETYWFCKELMDKGELCCPFHITHIDAHSDLAFSMSTQNYRFFKSFALENKQRFNDGTMFEVPENQAFIDSGSYLLAMALNRWLNKIEYVYHPDLDALDVADYIVKCTVPNQKFKFAFFDDRTTIPNLSLETIYPTDYQSAEPFDFVCVAISPAYTVKEIEKLVTVIKRYIIEI